ncbi:ERG4/ERG24 ergosterol biosynthesis-like protein [Sporormia fimetaria CBS 119925]|uniref:ERG4/ERG24 ergosterol biosynthesis-like protein n=1 Tax=Sporormia fimetaria CBS 119925 TaxID=1340428 RepID=A0A6A6V8C7_9PLEO|nr:ERG4/ERG24 ergosterol biosynthesis-like protein [Sporormia fimetaria CBS 119925]
MAEKAHADAGEKPASSIHKFDLITRGDRTPTPGGKAAFVLARALDIPIQYSILAHGAGTALLHQVGVRTLPTGHPGHTGFPLIDNLGLSPYRLVLFGMTVGSALKQIIWVTTISKDPMDTKAALIVGVLNTVMNGINNYAFLLDFAASTHSDFPQAPLLVGGTLYVVGILTELISEIQRKRFKDDPRNEGKPYTGGLWKLARHINYGAYTVWRAGYAMAAGGWLLGAAIGALFAYDFTTRAIPSLDEYCSKRYGADWEQFKRQTKYRLLPGLL